MIAVRSKWPHRIELALWAIGLALLGVAATSTITRWHYQQQQERALFDGGPAVSVPATPVQKISEGPTLQSPVAQPTVVARPKRHSPAADPTAVGRIEIPRLGLKAIVKQGADDRTLARAVGLVPGSARPGESGNVVLAGHRDTFFWPLKDIEVGDQIHIVVPQHTFRYRVQSVRVVNPDEKDVLASKGIDELTLVTCYPFRYIGPAPERFIVSAARVD